MFYPQITVWRCRLQSMWTITYSWIQTIENQVSCCIFIITDNWESIELLHIHNYRQLRIKWAITYSWLQTTENQVSCYIFMIIDNWESIELLHIHESSYSKIALMFHLVNRPCINFSFHGSSHLCSIFRIF